jgi:hypothetical protein
MWDGRFGFNHWTRFGILWPMGASNRDRAASTNPTIRNPREIAETTRRVDAHDSPVDGMDVLSHAPPEWAAFEVFVHCSQMRRLVHHSWERSKSDAQATMASLRDLGHRTKHESLGRCARSSPRKPAPPSEEQVAIRLLQQQLRDAWSKAGMPERAVPSSAVMLRRMIIQLGAGPG